MTLKIKTALSIFAAALTAFMAMETPYTGALGDYVLEFIGLPSWTGDRTGLHLTVIYFGILFFISLFFVGRYALEGLKLRKRTVFILFVVLMTLFSNGTGAAAKSIKGNTPGLLAIGYNADSSRLDYTCQNNTYSAFTAEFQLTNYSKETKRFSISIDTPYNREEGVSPIRIEAVGGGALVYQLGPGESRLFSLNLDSCRPVDGPAVRDGGGSGNIQELILADEQGDAVRLTSREFWGVALGR